MLVRTYINSRHFNSTCKYIYAPVTLDECHDWLHVYEHHQATRQTNIEGIPRNACDASGDISYMVFNVYDSEVTRGKGEAHVAYIGY